MADTDTEEQAEKAAVGRAAEVTEHPFERHVFVCTSGDWCARRDGDGLGVHSRLKMLVAQSGLKGRVRVNHAGCMDQCGHGPMVVVYPDNVWYWGVAPADVDEIVAEHLIGGHPVARLVYRNAPGKNKLARDARGRPIGRPARARRDETEATRTLREREGA